MHPRTGIVFPFPHPPRQVNPARRPLRPPGLLLLGTLLLPLLSPAVTLGADAAPAGLSPPAPTVAWVGEAPVTTSELEEYLVVRPFRPIPGKEGPEVRKRLDELLLAETLRTEALRQGIDRLPDVRLAVRELLARRLLDEKVYRPLQARVFTEKELRDAYEANLAEFSRPEQVRLADIFIALPEAADAAARDAARSRAAGVLKEALAVRDNPFGFSGLVRKHSDTHPKYPPGDTGFFDRDGKPSGLPVPLVEAAFALESNGAMRDGVIEEPAGFHVIMRTGRRAAEHRAFEEVRGAIEGRLRREGQRRAEEDYFRALREANPIRVDEQALEAFVAGVKGPGEAPDREGGTPTAPPSLPGASP